MFFRGLFAFSLFLVVMNIGELLERFEGVKQTASGYSARCPAHDDAKQSLSVKNGDGKILLHCFAGCDVGRIVSAVGADLKDLFSENDSPNFHPQNNTRPRQQIVAVYPYTDENGKLLYENVRFEPKDFRQRHYDRHGKIVWNLQGVRRVPYNLPKLYPNNIGDVCYLCEGEKDVNNFVKVFGLPASSFKNWQRDFNQYLSGKVVILADHDVAGLKLAEDAAAIISRDVPDVRIVDLYAADPLPEKHGKDISDWLEENKSLDADLLIEAFFVAVENTPTLAPVSPKTEIVEIPVNKNGRAVEVLSDDTPRYNDLANAERFLSFAGDNLLYCAEAKRWINWQGTHWRFDNEDFVFELAAEFARSLYTSEPPTKDVLKNADRANNVTGFNAMINLAARKKTVSIESFDKSFYDINCKNGTLDLRTGSLRPHSREDRITRLVDCDFDADARSEVFDGFMRDIQPDDAVRAFVQRSIGYSLLGVVRERSFWILYGTGNNGKSVFVNLFNNLLGDYASATTTQSVMAKDRSSIPNDIARLKGKRFIIIPETEENERLNSALVKALSAGDKMTARFLFGEFFDFYFSGKLWIATNHKPTITDHSKGFWDRLKLIPFTTDIPPEKVRKSDDLMNDLMRDAPAVLAWAVQGCRDYFEIDGLDVPPIIQAEIDAYRHEQDSIAQFLEAKCQTFAAASLLKAANENVYFNEREFEITNSDLYAAYTKFCKENGEYVRAHRRFSQNLKERGFVQRNSGGRKWEGLRLIES